MLFPLLDLTLPNINTTKSFHKQTRIILTYLLLPLSSSTQKVQKIIASRKPSFSSGKDIKIMGRGKKRAPQIIATLDNEGDDDNKCLAYSSVVLLLLSVSTDVAVADTVRSMRVLVVVVLPSASSMEL